MSWSAGFAKAEITAWEPELAMMGWGRMDNRIVGVQQPLFARAAAISRGPELIVCCAVELMAVSTAVRTAVLERLASDHGEIGLNEHNLMLTATHTHSGPSGYSHYFFVNLNGPGFSPTVFEAVVGGTVDAIVQAVAGAQSAVLRFGQGEMPLDERVAFNRSWFAYNLNEDAEPVRKAQGGEAVNRTMTVLAAETPDGVPLGCLTWYAVHGTSVHAENDKLHPDNKGIAAAEMEEGFGGGYVAMFAQEAAGDVSPNYRYDPQRRKVIGHYSNDYMSAAFNGRAQRRLAERILRTAEVVETGTVTGATHYVDFSAVEVSSRYARGKTARTTPATLGISMTEGTAEGPGPLWEIRGVNRWLTRQTARLRRTDDPKIPMLDVGNGLDARFLGLLSIRPMRLPPIDPMIRYVRDLVNSGKLDEHPWLPHILPLQLVQIGPLLIVGLPFEVTTVAGRRLRAQLRGALGRRGVEHVVVGSYSNAYAAYCTTYEEYQHQHYEAGNTLFGPHQLGAVMTMLDWMVDRIEAMPLGAAPPRFDPVALARRSFETPWPVKRASPVW